jgi:hypothetical protein
MTAWTTLESVVSDVNEFARKHNLTIEDRREYDKHGRQEFECTDTFFEPAYMIVVFKDRKGLIVKTRFVYAF